MRAYYLLWRFHYHGNKAAECDFMQDIEGSRYQGGRTDFFRYKLADYLEVT